MVRQGVGRDVPVSREREFLCDDKIPRNAIGYCIHYIIVDKEGLGRVTQAWYKERKEDMLCCQVKYLRYLAIPWLRHAQTERALET